MVFLSVFLASMLMVHVILCPGQYIIAPVGHDHEVAEIRQSQEVSPFTATLVSPPDDAVTRHWTPVKKHFHRRARPADSFAAADVDETGCFRFTLGDEM